jgi:hypothetical protein
MASQEIMKGHVWGERKDALDRQGNPIVTYPVMVEVKHDEIRVHVKVDQSGNVQFLSFAGKPLYNLDAFAPHFQRVWELCGCAEFDMGFEANGNFNDSYRWTRSSKGLKADLIGKPTQWYIFGLPSIGGTLAHQLGVREAMRHKFVEWAGLNVLVPECIWADTEVEVNAIYDAFRCEGYEGAMVKQPNYLYERKRTDGWLKMKPENDATGVIKKLIEAVCGKDQPELGLKEGDLLGRIGSVELHLADGSIATPHGIPHELGREMMEHPERFLEHSADFKYMERDRQGGYRHPTWGRLREAVV